jgi:hypothetical protein
MLASSATQHFAPATNPPARRRHEIPPTRFTIVESGYIVTMGESKFFAGVPKREITIALAGGLTAGSALFAIIIGVGSVGDFQALRLIEATLPTTRFLASSAIAAGVTILALILTLLSINLTTEIDFSGLHYRRVAWITRLSIVTIILSTLVLIAVTIPIGEVDELMSYYDVMYYVLAGTTSLVGAAIVATTLLIAETVYGLIRMAHPTIDEPSEVLASQGDDTT